MAIVNRLPATEFCAALLLGLSAKIHLVRCVMMIKRLRNQTVAS